MLLGSHSYSDGHRIVFAHQLLKTAHLTVHTTDAHASNFTNDLHCLKMSCICLSAASFAKITPSSQVPSQSPACQSTSLSYWRRKLGANCTDPRSGSWFGRMAEQSPLTGYEPNRLFEIARYLMRGLRLR